MNLAEKLDGTARAGGPVLEVRDLVVSYGGAVQALRGVSLTVEEGAVVALLGSNGAGKTTLLRALSGTLRLHRGRVEQGEIVYRGENLKGRDPARRVASGLVQVPEGRRIFTRLTVEENLRAGGLAVRERGRRAADYERIYEMFPVLADRRTQAAGTLSGGEQQMLALARVLAASPTMLIADEMSLGLAPLIVDLVFESLQRARDEGVTVLLIEQFVERALGFADQAVVLRHGLVGWQGPAADAGDELLAEYLGGETASTL